MMTLAACQPGPATPTVLAETPTPRVLQPSELEFDRHIDFAVDGVTVVLPMPKGWEDILTETGVIIAEHFPRLADRGIQQGLMASVFVTALTEFPDIDSANGQSTHEILTSLSEAHPDDALRSGDVQTFRWRGYDAAYYLVSEASDGPQMLIVGVTLPDGGVLLTGSVSAPRARAGQIREAAPLLLGGVVINGVALGPDGLDTLPDPLVFPE